MGCTATLLNDGTVLIAGGLSGTGGIPLGTAEIFTPGTGAFTPTNGNMNSVRAFHTATLLNDNTVLIAGRIDNNGAGSGLQGETVNTAEIYNPTTKLFTPTTGTMTDFRAFHTATLLNDTNHSVLLIGGDSAHNFGGFPFVGETNSAELYDPTLGTFTATTGSANEFRMMHSATRLPDNTVLVAGGFEAGAIFLSSGAISEIFGPTSQGAEIYDPSTQSFTCVGGLDNTTFACNVTMKKTHAGHTAVLLNDGTVLIAGGYGGSKPTSTAKTIKNAEIYNPMTGPSTGTFTKVGSMKSAHAQGIAALLQ
jgi:hypothetical protein